MTGPVPSAARTWAVFALALGVYVVTWRGHLLGWDRLIKPSPRNLYVHQAGAWLDGHLDVRTVGDWNDVTPLGDERHVSFPPAPAVLLVPLVAAFGLDSPDMLFAVLLGALSVAFTYRGLFSCNRRLGIGASARAVEAAALLYGLGTQVWIAVAWEHVSFFAHVVALAGMSGALWAGAERKGLVAGLAFAVAIGSRQAMMGAGPFLLYLIAGRGMGVIRSARTRELILGLVVPVIAVALMGWHNAARFGSAADFGYEKLMLADPEHETKSPQGLFSTSYVGRNAWYYFAQPPKYRPLFPWFHSRPEGMAIWFLTPAFALLFMQIPRQRWTWLAWACVGVTLVPALLHHYTGAVQWGCRFLLDVHPLLLLLFLRRIAPVPRLWHLVLIGLSILFTFEGVFVKHLRWFFPDMVI